MCATACGRTAARLEQKGIPTVILTREDFVGVVKNAVAGMGFAAEIPMVTFPVPLFLVGSDISPVEQRAQEFISGLTAWQPSVKSAGVIRPPPVTVSSESPLAATAALNRLFLRNRWGDGLPIVPPTSDVVTWVLQGTDRPPEDVLGAIMPKGGIVTVETAAVALGMAG